MTCAHILFYHIVRKYYGLFVHYRYIKSLPVNEAFITYCANSCSATVFKACVIIAGQLSTSTQQPNDVTYEEVPGPTHYNDPCQPISLENNEAYGVHKSGNEEMTSETCPQEVDLKSNEAYGVRGEVQESNLEDEANTEGALYDVIEGERKDVTESHIDEQLGMTSVQFQYLTFSFSNT